MGLVEQEIFVCPVRRSAGLRAGSFWVDERGRDEMRSLKILIPAIVAIIVLFSPVRGHAQLATTIPTPSPQPSASPTPRPGTIARLFHCNCTSPGNPVLWAGNVSATSFFQARQEGVTACLAYIAGKPVSPLIPTPVAASTPTFATPSVNPCMNCACN
jgi:hypothetical protein